jgi:hypothetical protein
MRYSWKYRSPRRRMNPRSLNPRFFDDRGFDLHDIAALAARRRDNRAHQGEFLIVNRSSGLSENNRWG